MEGNPEEGQYQGVGQMGGEQMEGGDHWSL